MKPIYRLTVPILLGLTLGACGGSDDDDEDPSPIESQQFAIKGTVKGLTNTLKLTLQTNGQTVETLSVQSDGTDKAFAFSNMQNEGVSFAITVNTQPTAQTCTVTNGSGTLSQSNAETALVTCETNANAELTGIFRDSPVAGIHYQTDSQTDGTTSDIGEFQYLQGEQVTFSVGAIQFPSTVAAPLVTPTEVAAGNEVTKVNILQLLQTLDQDCDVENGIQIKTSHHDLLANTVLDISSADFDSQLNTAFANLGSGLSLISEAQALNHFDTSNRNLLLGSWLLSEGEGQSNILTFIDHSRYILIHEHAGDGDQGAASVEYGNYTWDSVTGSFSVSLIAQSDGSGGLYDESSVVNKAMVSLNTLTLSLTDNGSSSITLTRIEDASDALIGTWHVYDPETDNDSFVTFLPNQAYAIVHTANFDSYEGQSPQAQSGEFGHYVKDASGYKFTASVESDGPNGLYDAQSADAHQFSSISTSQWGEMMATENGPDGGTFTLDKVGSFVTELVDKPSSAAGTSLGRITSVRDIEGFSYDATVNRLLQFDLTFATDTQNRCTTEFANGQCGARYNMLVQNVSENDMGDVIGEISLNEVTSNAQVNSDFYMTTAGTLHFAFSGSQTMTISPLLGKSCQGNQRALVSLTDTSSNQSLWLVELTPAAL
ncbi:hypothetical protein [Shewanella mangrovisoli]|uniref:hypothetical protein n=1 Tax=Shewanella mangrovisoli TaxID=2864211 RepID=UPI0035BA3657